jgi:hypothetical protein
MPKMPHVWIRQRHAVGNAAFALLAASVAGMGYVEVRMLHAGTIGEFGAALWWYQIPSWTALVALVCFVRLYLRAGRAWLGWSAIGLRTLALVGPGNVAKMRREAAKRGLDPDKWFNNVEVVAAEKIGIETTTYVRNIYKYYVAYRLMLDARAATERARQQVVPVAQ